MAEREMMNALGAIRSANAIGDNLHDIYHAAAMPHGATYSVRFGNMTALLHHQALKGSVRDRGALLAWRQRHTR